jgi:hypothetical protein
MLCLNMKWDLYYPVASFICKKCWPASTGISLNCLSQVVVGVNIFLFLNCEVWKCGSVSACGSDFNKVRRWTKPMELFFLNIITKISVFL